MINNYIWRICETCNVRNCKTKPMIIKHRVICRKKVIADKTTTLLDSAMKNDPTDLLKIVYEHGLKIEDVGDTYELRRRQL